MNASNPITKRPSSPNLHAIADSEAFRMKYDSSFSSLDPATFFIFHNSQIPSHRVIRHLMPGDEIVEEIIRKFRITKTNTVIQWYYDRRAVKYIMTQGVLMIRKNLLVYFENLKNDPTVSILFSGSTNELLLQRVSDYLQSRVIVSASRSIGVLVADPMSGLYIKEFEVTSPDIDISLAYNDDFRSVHDTIVEKLNKARGKGIILLHGCPGTGKTTYIRYLASVISKKMIFIPPEMAPQIASPDFLALMIDYPNSILIIEDAENVVRDRMNEENLSVSNLLNISDGLLSDCLNLQIICTFNTDISRIDKALLRKGRIIAKYEFKPLNIHKAENIAKILGRPVSFDHDMTLADVYHHFDEDFSLPVQKSIGFRVA
jgi:hypothetical protein